MENIRDTQQQVRNKLCLHLVKSDNVRKIFFEKGLSILQVLMLHNVALPHHCGGVGACGLCRIKLEEGPEITAVEHKHLKFTELEDGIRLACQVIPETDITISMLPLKLSYPRLLENNELLSPELTNVSLSKNLQHRYGMAVDFGTTQIRFTVWDLANQVRIVAGSVENPLLRYGSDVLVRVSAAVESTEVARQMSEMCGVAVRKALCELSNCEEISPEISSVVIVGNTAMLALIAESNFDKLLEPEYWMKEIECLPKSPEHLRNYWGLDHNAAVTLVEPIAGFVGSDLIAAVKYTNMMAKHRCALLIDFGTNSEIAFWDGNRLKVSSAAGGPAFDGCGLRCGMPAQTGAIYSVSLNKEDGRFEYEVINGSDAEGICGSGLVDAVACLLKDGRLLPNGRFKDRSKLEIILAESNDKIISVTSKDIDIYQRAKAAVAAGIETLINSASKDIEHIEQVYICGAFGQHLNFANSVVTGLLPEINISKFEVCGNAALAGCEELLFSASYSTDVNEVKRVTDIVDLAQSSYFEQKFSDNLYLQPLCTGGNHA